ncbi:Alpha-amylase A type-3 [Venturia inaequalis]|nr:Alpha-amylase A type-3 [Venturia inaequalis]
MPPKHRLIIDTDPGVDDTLALLLALSANPSTLTVDLITVTHGNVPVTTCLRNVVALFHHIELEMAWRKSVGRPEGFDMLRAAGAGGGNRLLLLGRGRRWRIRLLLLIIFMGGMGWGVFEGDEGFGLGEGWRGGFGCGGGEGDGDGEMVGGIEREYLFTPVRESAADAILRLLRENEKDSITIVAIGPLTNLAIAAAKDTEAFLRVKDVLVMGGALACPGNVTPVAEFNTYADSVAAARVYALTSRYPRMTMPVVPPTKDGELVSGHLGPYPEKLSRRLRVTLFPLDITTTHWLRRGTYNKTISPHLTANSPLAKWTTAFLTSTFNKMESLHQGHTGDDTGLSLHDPLCIWYLLTLSHPDLAMTLSGPQDLRVETAGQWTRGMYVVDRRDRFRKEGGEGELLEGVGRRRRLLGMRGGGWMGGVGMGFLLLWGVRGGRSWGGRC